MLNSITTYSSVSMSVMSLENPEETPSYVLVGLTLAEQYEFFWLEIFLVNMVFPHMCI